MPPAIRHRSADRNNIELYVLLAASGQVATAGNNAVLTPTAGTRLRLFYLAYNPVGGTTTAFFSIGGQTFLRNQVVANAVIAKDFGDFRCWEGAVDEALVLNLDVSNATNWNALYVEV